MNRDPGAWKRLGDKVSEARQAAGLSQAQLAEAAEVSTRSVYSAESGSVPSRQMPPSLVKIAIGLRWKPESIRLVLEGGEPISMDDSKQVEPASERPSLHPDIAELMLRVHEFGRVCAALGGSSEARDDFEAAAQRLFESVPRSARMAGQQGYGLAAYRPHALGEGVPEDDAERILRAMEEG